MHIVIPVLRMMLCLAHHFKLPRGDKEQLSVKRHELILHRNETQPLEFPNLGSMFKNPPNTFAAKLIEQAGLKGKRAGRCTNIREACQFYRQSWQCKSSRCIEIDRSG